MRGRIFGPLAIAIALSAMTAGGIVIAQDGADPGTANLWMDTNGGTCTRQSTAGEYVDAQACDTITAAVQASSAGDVVRVKAGSYGSQTVAARDNGNTNDVVIGEADGESVTFASIDNNASHVTFRGFHVTGDVDVTDTDGNTTREITDVTFDQIDGDNVFQLFGEVQDVTITNSDWGPELNGHPFITAYNGFDGGYPDNITIRGNTFHDFTRSGEEVHTECLQILAGSDMVVDSNTFANCDGTAGAAVANDMGPTDNIEFVNNWFDDTGDSGFAMQISANVTNFRLAYNSSAEFPFIVNNTCSGCGMEIVGNYASFNSSTCASGITVSNNVWASGTCNASDLSTPALEFVNAAAFDLHLTADSDAIGQGDTGDFPTLDIDGDTRTSPPDAGADER